MPEQTKKSDKITGYNILERLLKELDQTIDGNGGNVSGNITKGDILIKRTVNAVLRGDPRMLANLLKFIDKLDACEPAKQEVEEEFSGTDEEIEKYIMLQYYGKHKEEIEKELEKRYREDPNAWYFYEKYMR